MTAEKKLLKHGIAGRIGEDMANCQMCRAKITDGEYCSSCADYLNQSTEQTEQTERDEMRRWEYEEEMRKDAFGL